MSVFGLLLKPLLGKCFTSLAHCEKESILLVNMQAAGQLPAPELRKEFMMIKSRALAVVAGLCGIVAYAAEAQVVEGQAVDAEGAASVPR